MKAYKSIKLSKNEIATLKTYIDRANAYLREPEIEEDEVERGSLWWKKWVKVYSVINMPHGVCLQNHYWNAFSSVDQAKDCIGLTHFASKMYALHQMFLDESEVMIEDDLYMNLLLVLDGKV